MSAGKVRTPQRYIVAWPDGVVKTGSTWNGRRRWGTFLARGAFMLDLATYNSRSGADLDSEIWIENEIAKSFPRAFWSKEEAMPRLPRGGGYTECYAVGVDHFWEIKELAEFDNQIRGAF